jgi:hypothetical protein
MIFMGARQRHRWRNCADAHRRGIRLVGCWDTRSSMLGLGLAACCRGFAGMRCIVSYPMGKGDATPPPAEMAGRLGAELLPVPASRINICFAAARRQVEQRGGWMLPFGLECREAVEAVAGEAARVSPATYAGGTVVLVCGSGVTLAGLLSGFTAEPHRLVGVSSGRSRENIWRCVRRHVPAIPNYVELRDAELPNANYDLKGWKYLVEHAATFREPILFWNIGA